ncbi:LOW QUALITY PROTEIN: hypothetical protein O9K51_03739 [Purpureocillium lavendulum]|uniref:Uncharacterized protein n=1 Tax=Purpureocillium lavendulum TaxID=1247861 RepID=A0AB34FUJ8_9HYPO|nr:LOW QUALITY PROTEIN: hypothetical protein O9K51_03739 [Purpureocillium lavendulum]
MAPPISPAMGQARLTRLLRLWTDSRLLGLWLGRSSRELETTAAVEQVEQAKTPAASMRPSPMRALLLSGAAAAAVVADALAGAANVVDADVGAKTYEKVVIVVDQLRLESKFSPSRSNDSAVLDARDVLLSGRQQDESYCEAGNHCYIVAALGSKPVCCTDSACTAHVVNGVTTYASTRSTTQTFTSSSQAPDPTTSSLGPPVTSPMTTSLSDTVTSSSSSSSSSSTSPVPPPGPANDSGTPVGAIVGGVIGGVGAIALGALAVFLFLRRRSNGDKHQPPPPPPPPPMGYVPPAVYQTPAPAPAPNHAPYGAPPAAPGADGRASYYPPADKGPVYYTTPPPVSPHQSYAHDPRSSGPTSPGGVSSMSGSAGFASPPPGYKQAPARRPVVHEAPVQTSENHRGQMHELS